MEAKSSKHKNYEVLNLIGYGLAKFNYEFIKEFGFSTKSAFYQFCVENKVAVTPGTIKNRMDLFDYFFPENGRRGWWQKGDAYIHRKIYIDSLFGNEDVKGFANIVKLYLRENLNVRTENIVESPINKTRFKRMQETGLEAELFFINNYQVVDVFRGGSLEDARLYGDGYDFQVSLANKFLLAEVKGVRGTSGGIRFTENEYKKANEYKDDYVLSVVLNLNDLPRLKVIVNPVNNLKFRKIEITQKQRFEYQLVSSVL
ncbi:MAG: DUF3883 domain-containing protein [Anaerolineales bacterium]|nr:DUF3883 domain-containing protein [Anaerolineales bacterium]